MTDSKLDKLLYVYGSCGQLSLGAREIRPRHGGVTSAGRDGKSHQFVRSCTSFVRSGDGWTMGSFQLTGKDSILLFLFQICRNFLGFRLSGKQKPSTPRLFDIVSSGLPHLSLYLHACSHPSRKRYCTSTHVVVNAQSRRGCSHGLTLPSNEAPSQCRET